jgi:hypothetical protein
MDFLEIVMVYCLGLVSGIVATVPIVLILVKHAH